MWPILDAIFKLDLHYETTQQAIDERKQFLIEEKIGICDIVESAVREKVDASDLGMQDVQLRDVVGVLRKFPKIDTLLFTGGNSKNGPEYFFRRHLKSYNLKLQLLNNEVPRIHQLKLPNSNRIIQTVSLTAPSGAANRAVGSLAPYKEMKQKFPKKNTVDFRIEQYAPFFQKN
ncbi:MAG: uracil-DNA glycosylase family protein [Patiriisocius sp.]|uniref:uracil-DNA glycosylase family protein n=1 Tax=Patiriisocius sp. TaxID=2822396 RepID=UPI003EFADF42